MSAKNLLLKNQQRPWAVCVPLGTGHEKWWVFLSTVRETKRKSIEAYNGIGGYSYQRCVNGFGAVCRRVDLGMFEPTP